MSPLRKCLKQPRLSLLLLLGVIVIFLADSFREPKNQISVLVYRHAVSGYRNFVKPMMGGHARCRFRPSCSDYSEQAVRKHGIRRGLVLTISRLSRCTKDVPSNTWDPPP